MKQICPLISIIIPTRNRQFYTKNTVKNMVSYNMNLEIIVQDNSDDNILEKEFEDYIRDKKIIYNYVEEKIAGVDNYNNAMEFVSGKYICAIGDDDVVLPNIIDLVQWMENQNIDIVIPTKENVYFWPDARTKNRRDGLLWIQKSSGKKELCNTQNGVIQTLKNGGQNYLRSEMACSYHGIVRTELMRKVKEKTGRYYGGLSPDIYSATCLSLLPDIRVMKIDFPFTFPGVCPSSTSADSVKGRHIGNLADAPHFVGLQNKYEWDARVPEIYSVQTIWCETMLHALRKMGRDDLVDQYFNRNELINQLIRNNPASKDFILSKLSQNDLEVVDLRNLKIQNNIAKIKKRLKKIIKIMLGRNKYVRNCDNIEKASKILIAFQKKNTSEILSNDFC